MFSGRGPAGLRPRLLGSYSCQQDSGLLVPSWHTGVPVCWGRDRSRPTQVTGWGAHIPGSHPDVCSESWGTAGASCRRPCLPTCSHVFSGPMQEEELLQLLACTATCGSAPPYGARPSRSCCPAASPPGCTRPSHRRSGPAWSPPPTPRSASAEPGHTACGLLRSQGGCGV